MRFWIVFLGCLLGVSLVGLWVCWRNWKVTKREIKGAREELERQRLAAQAEQRRKQDLVAFLAHDLKTPLTSVVGYLNILRDKTDISEEERQRFTSVALDKALRLEELLSEFFDISLMDLQPDAPPDTPVQLSLLLEQLSQEFYPIFGEKKLKLETDIDQGLTTRGDPERLARVFDNVLKNAASYSRPGGTVELTARREGESIHISVSNQGLAIPEGELANIFQQFYRLDAARSSRTGGAGLGLAIAREIVESHGGSISAESTGETTTFRILLPAVKNECPRGRDEE